MSEVLVLDQSFRAVTTVNWKRAITLLWEGKVEVISEYEDRWVRSVTLEIKIPSVIRFLRSIRYRKKQVKFSRESIYTRDNGKCQYCSKSVPRHSFTYDHVIPKAQYGQTVWENVVVSCVPCNQKKSGRTPEQAGMVLLTKPIKPSKLPDSMRLTLTWGKGMHESWRTWLPQAIDSINYWHGELENSNK